jgi:hypothetical protein
MVLIALAGCLAACGSAHAATGATGRANHPSASTAPVTVTTTSTPPVTSSPVTTTSAAGSASGLAGEDRVVVAAWLGYQRAFYLASERADPTYPSFLAAVMPTGPVLRDAEGFLSAQADAGVVGPSVWKLGNVTVLSLRGSTAVVSGCAYDPGSHYRSSGLAAPASLGGGAGLTASVTQLRKVGGRWLVLASLVSSPPSTAVAGPCRGFSSGS